MPQEKEPFYVDEIQRDPTICNNCFRRCREVFRPTHWLEPVTLDVDDEKVKTVQPTQIRDSVPVRSRRLPVMPETDDAEDRRICKCGVFEMTTTLRDEGNALTKEESLHLAERLADRIEEHSSDFDRNAFRIAVWQYKSDEKLSNKDDEVYTRATEDAI